MTEPSEQPSPLDDIEAAEKLTAHVVSAGPDGHRLHGYPVESDLAHHYSTAETVLLTLTGEPPDAARGRAFGVVATVASTVTIGEGPAHAARVSHASNSSPASVLATVAMTMTEAHRVLLEAHANFLSWLEVRDVEPPREFLQTSRSPAEADWRRTLPGAFRPPAALTRTAALLFVLFECGLTTPGRMEAALTWARLPCAFAEATATQRGDLRDYPVNLPEFTYRDEPREGPNE